MKKTEGFTSRATAGGQPYFGPLLALFFVLSAALATQASQPPPERPNLPLLTRMEQVRNLTLDEAKLGYPVRLRGVVTYFNPTESDLFIQDSTAGIYIDIGDAKVAVRPGQFLEVEGVTAAPDFAPQVSKPRITILGRAPMPRARRVSYNRMASSMEDSQWVEVEGIVHLASKQGENLVLDLAVEGGRLRALIPEFRQVIPTPLVDAKVRIRGVCGANFNQKNQLVGVVLYVWTLAEVHTQEKAPVDPFAIPSRPIASLLRFTPQGASGHRVRVRGVVTLQQPGRSLFIKDETGGLYVHTQQATPVQAGDQIDAVGFPAVGEYSAVFQDAVFRRIGTGPSPAPIRLTAALALSGAHDADMVSIQARMLDGTLSRGHHTLNMEADNVIFVAQLEDAQPRKSLAALAPGSLLQLSGICMVEADEDRNPRAFRILLRSPDDIVLVKRPPWWTIKHMARTMIIMAALIFIVLLWAVVLKRQVREKTESIREWLRREAAMKARYQELFENANDMVFTCDLEGNFISLNKAGQRISGYNKAEALALSLTQIVAPEHSALARQIIQHDGAQDEPRTCELEIVTKEGRRVCLDLGTRLIYREGRPVEMQGVARDITERKRAADALRQAQDRYQSIFENSADGIFQTTPEGQLLAANRALAETLGYASPEELCRNMKNVEQNWVEPKRRSEFKRLLEERGAVEGFEYEVYRKDGSRIWISESSRLVHDQKGNVVSYEGTWRDITERRQLEEQLRQAQKMEAVGQLAGGIAHDFNNLLTIVSGYGQLLRGSLENDSRLREHVQEVLKAADRAASLTGQLLAFSRRQVLTPQVLDLNDVVANMDKMLLCLMGENHDLAMIQGKQLGRVMADPGQIEQVIMNLAVNARDAMPEGGRLTIETANVVLDEAYARKHVALAPGPYVMLGVSDTGCGMDAEIEAHMFEPFFTTKEPGKGTGLGLATVYGIVKQSGGYISVESKVGNGTTFKIFLPHVDKAAQQAGQPAKARDDLAKGSETVLVVEDENAVRSLVRGVLESNGYSVLEARHGMDALSLCSRHKGAIHLLLTDVVMPQMNGRELAEHLAPRQGGMKVLYMSGYADDALGEHRALDRHIAFINKPFTPDALARKVREVLDTKREQSVN